MATDTAALRADSEERVDAPARHRAGSRRATALRAAAVTLLVAGFGALTAVVFLCRAGSSMASNWPVNFDLLDSDNGVLYQVAQNIVHGPTLQWQFSPQVYVFPEIPMSVVAYALAGGGIYGYFVWVAVLNNCALFAALLAAVRVLTPGWGLRDRCSLAFLAAVPMLVLPLISDANVFAYHLVPTFYVGAYIFAFLTPVLTFSRSLAARIAVGVGYALTSASNPLLLAFTLPAVVITLLALYLRDGTRAVVRPGAWIVGATVAGWLVRRIFLAGMIGLSPSGYMSIPTFTNRLGDFVSLYRFGFQHHVDSHLRTLGLLTFALTLPVAAYFLRTFFAGRSTWRLPRPLLARGRAGASHRVRAAEPVRDEESSSADARPSDAHTPGADAADAGAAPRPPADGPTGPDTGRIWDHSRLARVLLLLIPVTSVLALFCALVLHVYYIWLGAVGSMIFLLLMAGRRVARYGAPIAMALLAVLLLLPGSLRRYGDTDKYFGYQPELTKCLDAKLPQGMQVGYATMSDARHYELTSHRGIELTQILGNDSLGPNAWLANKSYFRKVRGSFFLVNPHTWEPPIKAYAVRKLFGRPQVVRHCAEDVVLMIYTAPASQQAIFDYYRKF